MHDAVARKMEALLDMMMEDRECFPHILENLPQEVADSLNSKEFAQSCSRSFAELDKDGNGVLSSDELLPVLKLMLSEQFEEHHIHRVATDEHAQRLMSTFDVNGNGVLSLDEWIGFAKYVAAYHMLEAEAERENEEYMREHSADPGYQHGQSVDAILQMLREERSQLYQDLPVLPDWLRSLFEHEEFQMMLQQKFEDLKEEGSVTVDALRLIPVIVSLSQAHPLQVTEIHCQELLRIYDDHDSGQLSCKEFAEFTEFTFIMTCLVDGSQAAGIEAIEEIPGEEDQVVSTVSQADDALLNAQAQIRGMNSEMAWLANQLEETAPEMEMANMPEDAPSPEEMRSIVQDMRHLQLDLDFSNKKVEALQVEKQELLQIQNRLQAKIRTLEQRFEETEQKLQHQELDMRSMVAASESLSAGPSQLLSAGPSQILEADPSTLEGVPRGLEKMSRAQAIAALQLLHHEMAQERKAREKAERRAQKCLERLHRLMGTVERQRDDMSIMEKRCKAMESIAGDRERRLAEGLHQADSLRTLLRNLSEEPGGGFPKASTGPVRKPNRGPGGPLGGPLTRQRSAPNSLPVVHKR